MRTVLFVVFACMVAGATGVATAQTTTGRLIGGVVNDSGEALPGVTAGSSEECGDPTAVRGGVQGGVLKCRRPDLRSLRARKEREP